MKKAYRSRTDCKLMGVCGGIAKAYDIDSTIVRLATVFLFVVTGFIPIGVTYLAAWYLLPEKIE